MLGITDPWIITAYVLCILSALACIVYGLMNWNKGVGDETSQIEEEVKWEEVETKINETL
ncbi:MAG TPA: hypothetical protein PLW67_01725 [Prolixibacteraceae bacterium]|mgnify:CR=1 FL=1|nr:hypothetical protein [Prolixibacteraceae bacterium]